MLGLMFTCAIIPFRCAFIGVHMHSSSVALLFSDDGFRVFFDLVAAQLTFSFFYQKKNTRVFQPFFLFRFFLGGRGVADTARAATAVASLVPVSPLERKNKSVYKHRTRRVVRLYVPVDIFMLQAVCFVACRSRLLAAPHHPRALPAGTGQDP